MVYSTQSLTMMPFAITFGLGVVLCWFGLVLVPWHRDSSNSVRDNCFSTRELFMSAFQSDGCGGVARVMATLENRKAGLFVQ